MIAVKTPRRCAANDPGPPHQGAEEEVHVLVDVQADIMPTELANDGGAPQQGWWRKIPAREQSQEMRFALNPGLHRVRRVAWEHELMMEFPVAGKEIERAVRGRRDRKCL